MLIFSVVHFIDDIYFNSRNTNYHRSYGAMNTSQTASSAIPTSGYIRRFRMPELLGVSMPTIDRWVKNGTLPRPIKLSDSVTAFDAVEINNWLAERRGKVA